MEIHLLYSIAHTNLGIHPLLSLVLTSSLKSTIKFYYAAVRNLKLNVTEFHDANSNSRTDVSYINL